MSNYSVLVSDDDVVTVYNGREGGLLWIEPTVESGGPNRDELSDDSIAAVERTPSFSKRSDAEEFVSELALDDTTAGDDADSDDESTDSVPRTTAPTDTEPSDSAPPTTEA